jgi:hypothetical protein
LNWNSLTKWWAVFEANLQMIWIFHPLNYFLVWQVKLFTQFMVEYFYIIQEYSYLHTHLRIIYFLKKYRGLSEVEIQVVLLGGSMTHQIFHVFEFTEFNTGIKFSVTIFMCNILKWHAILNHLVSGYLIKKVEKMELILKS